MKPILFVTLFQFSDYKRSLLIMTLLLLWSISGIATADEPKQAINDQSVLQSIQTNILLRDSQSAVTQSNELSQLLTTLKNDINQENLQRVQQKTIALMIAWKKVEALYSAGNINNDLLDIPHYIDVYHSGNENIYKQLDRSLISTKNIKTALFKNSTKSINALEYIIFAGTDTKQILESMQTNNFRRIHMAQFINNTIKKHLVKIHQFYLYDSLEKNKENNQFVSQGKKSIEDLVNVLIDSSYKLLTWRVAEPAGLSDKYKDKPSVQHLEYYWSKSSFLAIEAILLSYQNILNSEKFLDLGDLGISQGVAEEMASVQKNITIAINRNQALLSMSQEHSLSQILLTPEYRQLYKALNRLHNSFYILLIEALGLQSKIIEADGD